jgi:hypothetical protein
MVSEWLNQRLAAGDASSTRGFRVELSSTPDIAVDAGNAGKWFRSSRPDNAAPTTSGAGAQESEKLTMTRSVETNPLTISNVSR